jgi:hypothetical protein
VITIDRNLLTPDVIDELIKSPIQQAMGQAEFERIQAQARDYNYYEGYQHKDPITGALVRAEDLPRPAGLDYDPTRFVTNYFKSFIKRKARWQMGGKHGISVPVRQIDTTEVRIKPGYQPSAAQQTENKRAEEYEKLLYKLWRENKMREKLMQAARDRLIAGRVAAKIVFNPNNGRIKWIFHPDTETFPVFSDDDYEDMLACHFIREVEYEDSDGAMRTYFRKQSFRMENGECYVEEAVYDEELKPVRIIQPKISTGLDFIPVQLFSVEHLSGVAAVNRELSDMKELTDRINSLNEDAIDSLKFEMFPMTVFKNVTPGTADQVDIAPGAAVEIRGHSDSLQPDMVKVESKFTYNAALNDQIQRLKAGLHEVTSLPNIIPQDLNFGGLNAEALQILFHDIIQETEEHWLSWGPDLEELHEKTIRYLQARTATDKFAYDKTLINSIGDNYENEMKFVLPLPDNRKELVDLLISETTSGFESLTGAMNRLGVENAAAKAEEIKAERTSATQARDAYNTVPLTDTDTSLN